ncbi:MAG: secondary thiamine-phosphate synthase enzyme YjbQ [Ignavibacteria bacterium]|nr:secondary thiamine-phosphate synthase enzyme YjbQ [Ignavibacteria bacterium]
MKIITVKHIIDTCGNTDVIDLTGLVISELDKSYIKNGSVLIFVPGCTASVTTIEYEPGLKRDLPELLAKLIPEGRHYHHNKTWGDNNAHAHLRSSVFGTSLNVPFENGELLLGTWQQIVLIDFDERPRKRKVIIQLTGE